MLTFNETTPTGKLSRFLYYSILGFIVSLFLKDSPVITNLFMLTFCIIAWLNVSPSGYLKCFLKNKILLGLVLFSVLQVISVLFSSNKADGIDILQVRASLFALPLTFCLIDFEQKTWRNILRFYVITTTIASVVGFTYGIYMTLTEHNTGYLYNDNISHIIGKQAVYFGLYVNMALFSIIYLLGYTSEHKKGFKTLLYICFIWLLFINYMLASKMSTVSLGLILLALVFWRIIHKKKILEGLILLFGLAIGVFILGQLFPKTLARFENSTNTSFRFNNTNGEYHFDSKTTNEDEWNSSSVRLALWECGKEIWLKHPVFGTGLGDIRTALKEKYTEKQFWFAINSNRNLHSQYIDVLVSMGLVGLLLFLLVFIFYPVKVFITRRQTFALCIFISMALCLLTENMFDRYEGEVLLGLMLPLSVKLFNQSASASTDYQQDTF